MNTKATKKKWAGCGLEDLSVIPGVLFLTVCLPSNGNEFNDVFRCSEACVWVGSACTRPLGAHGICARQSAAVGQNLETGNLSFHYVLNHS